MTLQIEQLRNQGIAVTPQRVAILAALQSRADHPTAEQIYQEVKRQLPAISFNTVYKTLEVFCHKGLAFKVNPLHEAAYYDGDLKAHAHLICRQCHWIEDLAFFPLSFPPQDLETLHGFQVEYQSVVLWGLCPRCRGRGSDQ